MSRKEDELTQEELRRENSEVAPDRESLSTVAGGWIGMATAADVAAEPSPVDDVYTIQPVNEHEA